MVLHNNEKITPAQLLLTIATITKRIESNSKDSNFYFIEVNQKIVSLSTYLIHMLAISADDALLFYTALLSKCNAFVSEDHKLSNKIGKYGTIPAFDLTDRNTARV